MEHREIEGGPDGLPVRVPVNEDYRMCVQCGDCKPDPDFGSDESGAKIAFVCPEHGINSVIDPFEHLR